MSDIIKKIEAQEIAKLTTDKSIPNFKAGDTLKVCVKIIEGKTERLQYFQGLCIARSNDSINSSFTVRKLSGNEGVERKFPLYSPNIASIELIRRGLVRRAKLYYMRKLRGKASSIQEKVDYTAKKNNTKKASTAKAAEPVKENKAAPKEAAPKTED